MYEAQLLATTSGSLVSSDTRLYTIDLDVPAVLPSGTYWISVQVNMDFVAGDFMWRERVVQNGNPFAFRNPGGGWGEGCTSWCGGHGIEPDLIFQLNGTKGNPMVTVLSTGSVKDVVLHKTQSLLFASDASANGVLVVDTSSDSIVNSIPVGSQPWGLAMSPDSSKAYVALSGGSALKVINTDSQSVTGMFTLSFSPKNAEYGGPGLLYITENSSTFTPIHIIDPLDGSEDATFGSFYRGGEIAISPDGNTLCVGESGLSPASVDCYDISAATPSFLIGNSNVGSNLQTIDISSDGSLVYLACGSPYHLQARYLSTLNVAGQYDTGAYPESALDSADGEFLFGSGGDSSWVWNADAYQKFRILDHKEVVFLAAGFDNRTAFASNDSLAIYHFTSFVDLAWNHWARSFIESIFEAGVTSGFPDGTYRPNNNVTRAEMAVFLKKGIHGGSYVPPTPDGSHPFSDIAGHWAEAWMEDLYDEGLTSGYPDGTYRPQNQVTRAEMAVFLLKAKYGSSYTPPPVSGGSFTDVAGHWAEAWIEQLAEEGITSGYPDGTYRPNNNVTRAEMAVFLVRTFNLPMP
jgi:YVTN family beta-propeller protein